MRAAISRAGNIEMKIACCGEIPNALKNSFRAAKRIAVFCSAFLSICHAAAFAADPVIDYDYTHFAVVHGGKFPAPIIEGETSFPDGIPTSLKFDGKTNWLTIPDGRKFSLQNGGTLYAVAMFDPKKENGMLFFKKNEFLLGLYQGKYLYFNLSNGKTWEHPVYHNPVPGGKWCSVAAVVTVKGDDVYVVLFINGKKSRVSRFPKTGLKADDEPVTVGKGWGGVWYFSGNIAILKGFDVPLSDSEIEELDRQSPYPIRVPVSESTPSR